MIKKSTLAVVTLLVIIVVVSGCTDNKNKTTNNTPNISNQTHNNTNNTTNNTNNSNIISPEEAKAIALQYVEEPGVTAGTPILDTINGRQVYLVPLYQNGKMVGEIEIDAVSGENLGGAGGAP